MLIVRHLGTPNSDFNGCHCMRDPVLYRSMLSMHVCMYVNIISRRRPHQHELVFMRGVKEEKTLKYLEITVQLQYKTSYSYTIYKIGGVYMTALYRPLINRWPSIVLICVDFRVEKNPGVPEEKSSKHRRYSTGKINCT